MSSSLAGRVYEGVKVGLFRGDYPIGKRLSIEALRTRFGVSKQPISEAFRLLAADGLVEILPRSGCVPRSYSRQEIEDFFAVFASFEASTTQLATRRRTPEQVGSLRRILSSHSPEATVGNSPDHAAKRADEYRLHNREFHLTILEMAQSHVVTAVSRRMMDLSDYLIGTGAEEGRFVFHEVERHDEHEAIVEAIQAQDEELARRFMFAHISRAGQFAIAVQ
ncbi:DNA-binding GntR family transcriptional regulator [Neomicrococcus aestuarii]|uniref:DNA-binding GntR family transcriptional regulator n=1 Tax=Neomicrococcus aestuarii TaxID=556325 RepID=A0A7W8WZN0_9MICC|nr:GntR family transcriptional regulator [Neomicrococcus aestuarii]MBB5512495.1 DNA-binding GntR family transcriptional regulator [Neomicrococcus aestuarii]